VIPSKFQVADFIEESRQRDELENTPFAGHGTNTERQFCTTIPMASFAGQTELTVAHLKEAYH